jgi:hypothetical protein
MFVAEIRSGRSHARGGRHLDAEFVTEVPEDFFEVGVVGVFAAEVAGELVRSLHGHG